MKNEEVFNKVCACIAAAIDVQPEMIRPTDRIVADLGADSLDFLDLTFHVEQAFGISFSPLAMEKRVRERLGEVPLEVDGVYTPEALGELKRGLPEIPAEEFTEGLTTTGLPRLIQVQTIVNQVLRLKGEKNG